MSTSIQPMYHGPIWKRMTFFALPIFFGSLFQQLYNTVDSLIVGNYLGSDALAAVTSSGSLIFLLIGFLGGIASGAGVVIARHFGADDINGMRLAIHTTVASGLVAGVIMTVVGMKGSPYILAWMGTPDSVIPESTTYLTIYFSGSIGFIMYNVFVGILQAVGDSRHPLYYLIASSIINFVLDVVFIGFLHTGVGGAAFATVISQVASACFCFVQLTRTKEVYRLRLREIRFHADSLKQIIRIGLPSGVQNSIIAFANLVVQSNINSFGPMAMAGCGAYNIVEGFGFLPITSFTMALTTFISQNLGANQLERAKKGARFGILTTVILAELVGLVIFAFAPMIISAFDSNPEVVQYGVAKAHVSTLFFFLLAFTHAMAAIFRGAGKAWVPMFIMLAFWCIVRVSFLVITIPLTHSIQVVYWVYPLTWFLSSAALLIYYKKSHFLPRTAV